MKKAIRTINAPSATKTYSQAIEANGMIFVSGQLPIDVATGNFVEGGVKEQTTQSLKNIKAILAEAGLTMDNVVKTTVFLADISKFAAMNEVYEASFGEVIPARSAFAVQSPPKAALVVKVCCVAS